MLKFLSAPAAVLALIVSTGVANANPYNRAVTPEQCDEIREISGGIIVGGLLVGGIAGGVVASGVNNERYAACLKRFIQYDNGTGQGAGYGNGQTSMAFPATCPPNFSGIFRGTLYCENGVLLR